jgi:hypothetical protein
MRTLPLLAILAVIAATVPAGKSRAHEFWISPDNYAIETGDKLLAALRVGQNFSGSAFAFIPQNFSRFEIVTGDQVTPVEGRMGDLPALNIEAGTDGLAVVVHQTTPLTLNWAEWQKFVDFCKHKDFDWAIADHRARGLPETGFRESYTRYAKSLIRVGSGAGADKAVGLETEIVALANPYTDDLTAGMPVLVLYKGKPRMDVQVEVFSRDGDGSVEDRFYRTDMDGTALIPVAPGTEYLFDAVVMRPSTGEPAEGSPVWESLWASLTFRTPG